MEEEASGGARGRADPPAASSPVPAAARKTVRLSDVRDFIIPSQAADHQGRSAVAEEGSPTGSSVSAEAAAAAAGEARAPEYHASGLGSPSPPGGVPCDGALQDTPDYIRRGASRHRVAPLELFPAASTPPPPPGGRGASEDAASAESRGVSRTGGARQAETVDGAPSELERLQAEEGEPGCCGQLKQQYGLLLREKEECRRLLEDLMRENVLKTRECREAQESLRDLQMELMRKSMCVGSVVNQYATLECEFKDLKEKFSEEAKERKDLYNKVIELKEEIAEGASTAIDFESAKDGELIAKGHVSSKKVFKFDSVFSPEEDREKVFEKTAPFATSVLDGFNVRIFAYGQTGTEREGIFLYEVTVSVLEVYNEQIHDLLLTGSQPSATTKSFIIQCNIQVEIPRLMFVQISPNENDVGETLCSLNFASRVRGIELGQARKQVDVGELSRYKLMVGRAKQDSKNKDAQIKSMEETIQSLEAKNKAKDLLTMNLQEKIKELESQLLVERKIARQHVDNKIAQDHLQKQHSFKEEGREAISSTQDFGIAKQMFSDSNADTYSFKQLMSLGEEKENNPEAGQLPQMAKARRVSLCNGGAYPQPMNQASRRTSLIPLPRRNSLMPLPTAKNAAAAPPPLDDITEHLSSPPRCSPPVVSNDKGSRSKRINSILRRSLQKKVIIRPSMTAQAGRKASAIATTQGTDGARKARRVPVSGGAGQRVQQNRDKEPGWNNATSLRNNF
ncbi:kinesin KP1 isoform X2 [Panicum miliaceum]|uniref:Kinesin KP1 isoform X2 n=1 Tax=Panicum miliaceum TaxID=4540 RepID=A0A3L6PV97_PANMI|nr:kinesin KP1 isoform X2 [Panicum miliaceum]